MDMHIEEVNSTVHTTDGRELLSPEVLQQIVKVVLERLRAEQEHERRVQRERDLHTGALIRYTQEER